jgi:alpha-L-rhamnosidase
MGVEGRLPVVGAALLLLLLLAPLAARAQPDDAERLEAPHRLRVEYRAAPLGIDVKKPRLSWVVGDTTRGAMQSSYQIQVASSPERLTRGNADVWDSGKTRSGQSVHVVYDGPPLESRERYWWRVRTWNEEGDASAWSQARWWEMGLLEQSDWRAAQWIEPSWTPDSTAPQPSPTMRTEFTLDAEAHGGIERARLYATAHGLYAMHLNGRRVSRQLFTPGWTSYHQRLPYQTFDVTDRLEGGRNALGAVLGDGWYRGYIGFGPSRNVYGARLALLAQLCVTYADGTTRTVATGPGWRATRDGPIRRSDIYLGETYDARRERDGWSTPGYAGAGGWQPVRPADHAKDGLVAPADPPVRRIQTLEPVRIFETPDGTTVADLGQNMVGWVRLKAEGAPGTTVTLRHAEVLGQEGNLYTKNLRSAAQTDTLILGDEPITYEPHFTFHGFRYVAVEGYPGELTKDDLEGVVLHSDMGPTGHFESSSPLVNQLQHNIVWGQKGNFLDVPTDCPQRDERLGWTGDAQVFAETATFNMGVAGFFTKWLRDLAADQYESGSIPWVVPDVLEEANGDKRGGAAGWADAGVIVPWVLYRRYGDTRILRRQYDSMSDWVAFAREQARKGGNTYVWNTGWHFGDWLAYSTDRPDYPGATTSKDLVATAYFARSAHLMAKSARVLGKKEDAERYERLFEHIRRAFQQEFVTPRGRATSDTQTAYVLALAFDLLPEAQRDKAVRRLADDVRGFHLTTGFLGTPDLTHVLTRHGETDLAYDLLMRTDYPSWLYPVTKGATTMWERWDGIKPDGSFQDPSMNSFNHYAYGAVGDWLYGTVAGLQPAAPGYERIRIAPRPGDTLTRARAFYESIRGRIGSSWQRTDGERFRLTVEIPPNTRATVRLPGALSADAVTESGQPLREAEGLSNIEPADSSLTLDAGAGRYVFSYPADGLAPMPKIRAPDTLNAGSKVAALLADPDARAALREHLPELMRSPWLSQVMAFSLRRAVRMVPLSVPKERLRAVEEALQER